MSFMPMNAGANDGREYANDGRELPDGMLDYEARCAVRNLIRLYGFEGARERFAGYLIDELERKTIDQ